MYHRGVVALNVAEADEGGARRLAIHRVVELARVAVLAPPCSIYSLFHLRIAKRGLFAVLK